ncbi:MAG: alpha/beta fold hydrolase [Simkaniaceae bacterium]|nr:alpha/beta fold hydrolase [Simkaniaceae bacterium]MCF7852255.1 alpha/beta fold hydrolase [Simkaniaceae bacterium]
MHKKESFDPLPLFGNYLSQTIFGSLFNVSMFMNSKTEYVRLPDGDLTTIEVTTPKGWKETDPTVVLVHGLCGSHRSPYLIRMTRKMQKLGIRSARVNLRNCGSGRGLSKHFYHCGSSDDVGYAIKHLKAKSPKSPTLLIGFSLGGNLVLKLAGELSNEAIGLVDQVYAVSPPIKLVSSMRLLSHPNNKIFERYFLRLLVSDVYYLQSCFPDVEKITFPNNLTILDFDELYIAPRIGYLSAFEYYRACSAINVITDIAIPCKILFAEDDPIIDSHDIDEIKLPDHVEVYKTDRGGHLGFLGSPTKSYGFRWMDGLILSWIKNYLKALPDRIDS